MKVVKAKIDWMEKWSNNPELVVAVEDWPSSEEFRYEQRGNLFFAEKDGAVSFFSHSGKDENLGGYGGDEFKIRMIDGTEKILKGPWSSRSGVMNREGFTESVEVRLFEDIESYERGYTALGAHITLEVAKEAIKKFCPKVYLVKVEDSTDVTYVPSLSKDKVVKPKRA